MSRSGSGSPRSALLYRAARNPGSYIRRGLKALFGGSKIIHGHIDMPQEPFNIGMADSLWITGWAYSSVADIARIEAVFDGVPLGELNHGLERPDVAEALGLTEVQKCGFSGTLLPHPATTGNKALHVIVTDKQGNSVTFQRTITIGTKQAPPRMYIDQPLPHASIGHRILVSGWIYDPAGRPIEVRVVVKGKVIGTVSYGLERPDIYELFQTPQAARCGFRGSATLLQAPRGQQIVVVQAYDTEAKDVIGEAQVSVQFVQESEPLAELERVAWRGDLLEVEGWAIWPSETATDVQRKARVFLDDKLLGESRVYLSRPDIAEQFLMYYSAQRSGFRFTHPVPGPSQGRKQHDPSRLAIEFDDGHGYIIRKTVPVIHKAGSEKHLTAAMSDALHALVDDCSDRLGSEPSILDWNTGLELAKVFPHLSMVSPIGEAQLTALPYVSQSIDVVVVASADPIVQAEAHRICTTAVATVGDKKAVPEAINVDDPDSPSDQAISVWWRPDLPSSEQLPSASVVITAYNKIEYTEACIRQVLNTLPAGVDCEVIVVDDASTDETPVVLQRIAAEDTRVHVIRNEENVGFLVSCNRGAASAQCDVIVFLNNDTLPQPGWLTVLLRTLRDAPLAGAVGGKLMYPNGTLQEAGGLVFSDGSAANYGRNDPSPDAPLYNYLREVDYCTGALLGTWRNLYQELNGFDLRYRPLYYEETDYCFKVRDAGYRVYYQPESRVIHFEGVTAGTDLTSGLKSYQVINHQKFTERWKDSLPRQAPPPKAFDMESLHTWAVRHEREMVTGRRRAVVFAPRMPEFDREAGSKRVYDLIYMLRNLGWTVSFVADNAEGQERYFRPLQQMGVATYAGPDTKSAGDEYLGNVADLLKDGKFDIAIVAFWSYASQLLPVIRTVSPATRVIVDSIDLHLLRQARKQLRARRDTEPSLLDLNYAQEMIGELNTYVQADAVLTVSGKEASLINDFTSNPSLAHAIPLVESITVGPMSFEERTGVLFVGNFRHAPNAEAVEFLCAEVEPLLDRSLLARHPISIVGTDVNHTVVRAAQGLEHVRLVGWVPSVIPYLYQNRVTVVPLLHGAGTKGKLIQALASGTSSVSTSVGIEGLNLRNGEDVLVADTPDAFAAAITRLLTDAELWSRIAESGRHKVADAHHPEIVQTHLEQVLSQVMSKDSVGLHRRHGQQRAKQPDAARNQA